jgi:two-component system, sporulation sensor kinase D|tara:strand:+ start:1752 stop:2891 length:1140 start_codon:yes stop_codon:yes gene_type:complete
LKQNKTNKTLLLLSALVIGIATLWFTNGLVKDLKSEERTKVKIWAKATEQTTHIDNLDEDISFVFEVINHNNTIPVILTDDSGKILYHKNFPLNKVEKEGYLNRQLLLMKENSEPIVFEYADGKENRIYYKDSIILTRLKYFPYVILLVVALFILIGYLAFSASRKSEQNKVWAGMARETAHQIGTPLSSLMGWVALLQEKPGVDDIALEMNKDILRLQTIAERFSKIGSQPELSEQDITKVLKRSFNYMKDRSSAKVIYKLDVKSPFYAAINPQLFGWVIENILRNAIDALEQKGTITLSIKEHNKKILIDIKDSGKGIKSNELKTVFEPGFTTKKRGWGLGLSLVKRIVEDYHKGQVFVHTSELNKGTTFRIILNKA